jgi:hypothetical protein
LLAVPMGPLAFHRYDQPGFGVPARNWPPKSATTVAHDNGAAINVISATQNPRIPHLRLEIDQWNQARNPALAGRIARLIL